MTKRPKQPQQSGKLFHLTLFIIITFYAPLYTVIKKKNEKKNPSPLTIFGKKKELR